MDTTDEDARLLFDKWQDDSLPLAIRLLSSGLIFEGAGAVLGYSVETLELGGDSWRFTVPLTGALYRFSDPREIPLATVRAMESAKYELGLSIKMSSGDELVLMEMKVQES